MINLASLDLNLLVALEALLEEAGVGRGLGADAVDVDGPGLAVSRETMDRS